MRIENQKLFKVKNIWVDCNFELKDGLNILSGSNGIGKTSFLNFLKVNKKDIFKNHICAFMDQASLKPISELTGAEILNILSSDLDRFDKNRALDLVEQFGFNKLLNAKVEVYSGGENQVFKFILLVAQNSDIYFLDEPLQYLDDDNVQKMLKVLDGLKTKKLFMVEHRKEKLNEVSFHQINMKNIHDGLVICDD